MANVSYEIEVGEQGDLRLPADLRESLGLQAGDTVRLVQTDDHLLMIPTRLLVPEFAAYMQGLLAEKGLTLADLLAGGEDEREKLFRERYEQLATD